MGRKEHDMKCSIIAIDAWSDGAGGWSWNAWYRVGTYTGSGSTRSMKQALGKLWSGHRSYDDDGFNMVLCDNDSRPVLAVAYGEVE
jgi:hypothetical protein